MWSSSRVSSLGFRNLADARSSSGPGLTLLWGPNGAGKTNLLEAIYFGARRPLVPDPRRARDDRLRRALARVEATVAGGGRCSAPLPDARSSRAEGRRHLRRRRRRPGPEATAAAPGARRLHARPPRAGQGPARRRRAHLDGFCAALWPARAEARRRYSRRAGAAQRPARPDPRRRRRPSTLDAWDRELGDRRRRADRDPRRGGRGAGAAVREAAARARARRRGRRCATGRGARRPTPTTLAAELAARRDARPRPRLHRLGPAPRRGRARARRPLAAPLRLPGPAAAGAARRCCSPSARPCSTTAARRR